jgi:hypothetical protein
MHLALGSLQFDLGASPDRARRRALFNGANLCNHPAVSRAFLLIVATTLSACIENNPNFEGVEAGQPCAAGVGRTCIAAGVSATCMNGSAASDRLCPSDSRCSDGFCRPPAMGAAPEGASCNSENKCYFSAKTFEFSCQPFHVAGNISFVCAKRIGDGAAGATCTTGADCRTGFCVLPQHVCFRGCNPNDATDCPLLNGRRLACRAVTIDIEGASTGTSSCVPN